MVVGATADITKILSSPAKAGFEIDSRKHAINLSHELALIVEGIDGALNEIIATLGFNEYPVLFLIMSYR